MTSEINYTNKLLETENPAPDSKGPFQNNFTSLQSLLEHVKQYGIPFGQQTYSGTTDDGKIIAGVRTWVGDKENLQDSHTVVDANPQKHGIAYTYFKRQHLMSGFNLFCDVDNDGDGFDQRRGGQVVPPKDNGVYVFKTGKFRNTRMTDVPAQTLKAMLDYWSDKEVEEGSALFKDLVAVKNYLQ